MIEREVRAAIWRAQLQRTLAWTLAVATGGAAAWRIAQWSGLAPLLPSVITGLVLFIVAVRLFRSRPVNTAAILEHFNRSLPEFEESAALLHGEAAPNAPLERLQRARVEAAWQARATLPPLPLPSVGVALRIAAAATLLGAIIPAIPTRATAVPGLRNTTSDNSSALAVGHVALHWSPPRYTGLPARDATTLWDPLESTCRHASLSIL